MVRNCLFVVFASPCRRDLWFLVFCLQRFALECEIPTRVASVATQGTMQQCQAEARSITCLITRNSSNSAKQLKNNTKHTAHQSQRRQWHQRSNGANSVSGTNGASNRMNNNTYGGGNCSSGSNSNSNSNSNYCSRGIRSDMALLLNPSKASQYGVREQ